MAAFSDLAAEELVRDVCSGMTDVELTEKYRLTPKEFHLALSVFIDSGLLTRLQLEEQPNLSDSQII